MSIQTTYTCDCCGAKQETSDQFWVVQVMVRAYDTMPGYSSDGGKLKHWCRECCEKQDILPSLRTVGVQFTPPTFEDLIREIVREEVGA